MPLVSSYHFLLGPIVAVAALGLIVLICRWVFSTDHRTARPTVTDSAVNTAKAVDHGLLVPLTTVRTQDDAEMLRDVLRDSGIRAGITPGDNPGEHVVLVFSRDVWRAKALVVSG